MTTHAIVSREKWLEARRDLLAAEKDLTHRSDQVAELRRKLPWVRVEKPYVFEGPNGKVSLADLFAGRSQLLVQHFMLAPGWKRRLQELFLHGRPHRRHDRASGAARCHLRCDLACALQRDRALPPTDGLALQLGLLERQQLQP